MDKKEERQWEKLYYALKAKLEAEHDAFALGCDTVSVEQLRAALDALLRAGGDQQ